MKNNNKKYSCIPGVQEDAIYTAPLLDIDKGNLLIESLPPKLSYDDVLTMYYKNFPVMPSIDAGEAVQAAEIDLLSSIYIPLKYCHKLEEKVYLGLLSSYRQRKSSLVPVSAKVTIDDTDSTQEMTMRRAFNGDNGKDIALLGVPGTGKSECINRLISHYPQHIVHHTENGTFHQILWIKIEPSSNNDLATLYDNFGTALDEALGNSNVYASLIRKKRKLGEKANYI